MASEAPATTGPDGREFADEQVYRTLYSGEITTLNYLVTTTTNDFAISANVIDTLVEYDRLGEVQPSLAESWSRITTISMSLASVASPRP